MQNRTRQHHASCPVHPLTDALNCDLRVRKRAVECQARACELAVCLQKSWYLESPY